MSELRGVALCLLSVIVSCARPDRVEEREDCPGVSGQHKYAIVSTDRLDYANTPRMRARLRVPRNLSREALELSIRAGVCEAYWSARKSGVRLGAVMGYAYQEGADIEDVHDAGRAEFAPHGDWSKADPTAPFAVWRAKTYLSDSYFSATPKLAAGTIVVVVAPRSTLSDSPEQWDGEHHTRTISEGTKAQILDSRAFEVFGANKLVRYKVRIQDKKKPSEGWLHADDVAEEPVAVDPRTPICLKA